MEVIFLTNIITINTLKLVTIFSEKVFKCHTKYLPLRFICDGISQCENKIDEDPAVCSYLACDKKFYKCQENKCIDFFRLCNGIKDCHDGTDESPLVCKKLLGHKNVSCPVIFEEKHIVTCRAKYGIISSVVSCFGFLPPGTEAEVRCKLSFNTEESSNYQVLTCLNNGTWDQDVIKCKQGCGKTVDARISPLIINGLSANPISWPWYSALFTMLSDRWTFFCSSTIISSSTVVTAAHCVWEMPKETVKVVAGKMFSDFYREESSTQITDVTNIFIHPLYQDSLGNYGSDIAVIKLETPFSFTEFVLPICVNWSLRNNIKDMDSNFEAKVAGMGISENGSISNELRNTGVQIIPNEDCLRNQRYEFRKYITIASFCAKGIADAVVCNGDSGSGLAVRSKMSDKWFLEGVISISPKNPNDALCDKKYYTIYTKVGMYTNWIYEHFSD